MRLCRNIVFLICALLFIPLQSIHGQIVVKDMNKSSKFSLGDMSIVIPSSIVCEVQDSLTLESLPDVVISISDKKRTTRFVSNEYGYVDFPNKFMKDSVVITASLLGYKTLSLKTALNSPLMSINIRMAENAEELNAVIVKANTVLMVSRGDTTVYNVENIKTLEGADLSELLKKLPGIEIEKNGTLMAAGRKVNKVLINGRTLFGSNISSALRLVESDMVKKIRVYDEHNQDRLLEADTLGTKDHVIDVVTKEPLTKVRSITLALSSGGFTENNEDKSNRFLAGLDAKGDRYELDKPKINFSAKIGKNENSTEPAEYASGSFSSSHKKQFKNSFEQSLNIRANRNISQTASETEYREIDRSSTAFQEKDNLNANIGYSGSYSFSIKEKNSVTISGNAAVASGKKLSQNTNRTEFNGAAYGTDISDNNHLKSLTVSPSLSYHRLCTKPSRTFDISASLTVNASWNDRNVTDTLQTTSCRQWMTEDLRSTGFSPKLHASYKEPLGKNGLYMNITAETSGTFSKTERNSFDRLLMVKDFVKSYSYTQNNISTNLRAGLFYRKNKFELSAGVAANVTDQIVNEKNREDGSFSNIYFLPSPVLISEYAGRKFTARLSYNERGICPSVESLRKSLDYTDPLFLHAGNPALKLPVSREAKLSMSITSFPTGTTWKFSASFNHMSNIAGNDTEFFTSDTYLEEFDYNAVAGAQIVRAKNIGNGWNFNAGISSSFNIVPIQSSFNIKIGTTNSRTPFMTNGVLNTNGTDELNIDFVYLSHFSSKFYMYLMTSYGLGQNTSNSDKIYSYSRINLSAKPELMLKHWYANANYDLNAMITDLKDGGYNINRLDFEAGYKFGKSIKYHVGITVFDCLNSNKSRSLSFSELYIRRETRTLLGRGISVKFYVNFK